MNTIKESLVNWLNAMNNFSFKDYKDLPELDLYMDQVITFLEKQLYVFKTSSDDKQITPSMINNYVKGDVLPAPISKKYNKEHLALIEEICTLKQVLSIRDVKQVLDNSYKDKTIKGDIFDEFNKLNNEKIATSVEEAFKKLNNIDENDTSKLIDLAMDFALTANAYITIANRILYQTYYYQVAEKLQKEQQEAKAKEEAKKNKKKEND